MRGSDFVLTQINCAHSHMHRQPPTLPSPSQTSQPSISLDETRPRGFWTGTMIYWQRPRGGRVEAHAGDCWSCVSCDRAGMGWWAVVRVCVCVKGGETQGFKLGGGCVSLFWWGFSCRVGPRRIPFIQQISGVSFCCQSQPLRCVSELCSWTFTLHVIQCTAL